MSRKSPLLLKNLNDTHDLMTLMTHFVLHITEVAGQIGCIAVLYMFQSCVQVYPNCLLYLKTRNVTSKKVLIILQKQKKDV